jgi:replicative DNA helicase
MGNVAASTFISSPAEAYKDLLAWDELYKTLPKVFWFNDTLARNVSEILPGEMVGWIGRTGNGKTSVMLAQAYHQAKQLLTQKKELTNFVCYFTWDQPKERLEQRLRRAMEADGVKYTLAARMELPLWFVGKGMMDAHEEGYKRTALTVELVENTLNQIMKWEKKPSLLLVDYLQNIPGRGNEDKTNQVMRVAQALSDFASDYSVSVMCGSQSVRDVDKQLDKTPALGGSRWSAEFEDKCDTVIGGWRPCTSEKPGVPIDVNGKPYMTDSSLMKCTKWKDREGAANVSFAFPFDMVTLQAGDYE